MTDPMDPQSGETLDQVPLGTFPPTDGRPVILPERIQEDASLTAWQPVLQTTGPWGSAATPVRWSYFLTRVQFHFLGQTKAGSGGDSHHMWKRPDLQTLQEGGLIPITGVGQHCPGRHSSNDVQHR